MVLSPSSLQDLLRATVKEDHIYILPIGGSCRARGLQSKGVDSPTPHLTIPLTLDINPWEAEFS